MDEEKPKKKLAHEIGCDLAAISVEELRERIVLLQDEVVRLQASISTKEASKQTAESFFKR